MEDFVLQTPVAFLIFNRPERTRRVFQEIARARPRRLLIVADGPRFPEEEERCAAARSVLDQINWDCEVLTNLSDKNLGCRKRVSSGLDWVFEQCEEAIILEDDCLPHLSFFRYCAELLERYRDDERIMAISGDNFQFGQRRTPFSYYFSRFLHIWGWASWRRAWQHYDVEMRHWPALRETGWLADVLGDARAVEYFRAIFDKTHAGQIDTWDYQWSFACWSQSGMAALPEVNLISNIGWGDDATHTKAESLTANLPTEELQFPLRHPPCVIKNREADQFTFEKVFADWTNRGLPQRLRQRLARLVSGLQDKPAATQTPERSTLAENQTK
ncbi:MAG TPA: hypothetical protein VGB17_00435 [Pyrinomonadaceae bacterium]|jgi:hypothetical protein